MLIFHNFSLVRFYSILKVPRGTIRPSPHRIKRWTHTMKTWQQNDTGERKDATHSSIPLYAHEERPRDNGGQKKYNPREAVRLPASQAALHHILVSPTVFAPPIPSKLRLSILSIQNKIRKRESQYALSGKKSCRMKANNRIRIKRPAKALPPPPTNLKKTVELAMRFTLQKGEDSFIDTSEARVLQLCDRPPIRKQEFTYSYSPKESFSSPQTAR